MDAHLAYKEKDSSLSFCCAFFMTNNGFVFDFLLLSCYDPGRSEINMIFPMFEDNYF